ncbi:hypothetical protein PLICRDRAFT_222654 [Plicaturopsis crispa FD-325 SS-3]|nr:hypothetical protein PLICRDRAFT_222654 [Plicaturopsis crispa FD-325 SS-3]
MSFTSNSSSDERRTRLRSIAESTLDAIKFGSFTLGDLSHDLANPTRLSKRDTRYYAPDSLLSSWSSSPPNYRCKSTKISILEISTLDGARLLSDTQDERRTGVLNFASAKKPGGGFINGAQAQEESIARSSSLYPTLMTSTAQQFYTLHNRNAQGGFYSHAMIYSPRVLLFRDDDGGWTEPIKVDVLTSAAVNAGVVRNSLHGRTAGKEKTDVRIRSVMRQRMARILFLFEQQGRRNLVLGSFGTGVFRNDVDVVARLWAELLVVPGARFKESFDTVLFAILGKQTYDTFKDNFYAHETLQSDDTDAKGETEVSSN